MDFERSQLNDIQVSSDRELVDKLRLVDSKTAQDLLNQRFPLERRNQMLKEAPQDIKGRQVRFYRRMHSEYLITLLERGEISAYDYYDTSIPRHKDYHNLNDRPHMDDLQILLSRLDSEVDNPEESDKLFENLRNISYDDEGNNNLVEFVQNLFPSVNLARVQEAFQKPTFGTILKFVEEYFPLDLQKKLHTGSLSQKFSSLLSLSVGGVIRLGMDRAKKEYDYDEVYVEMVIPEEDLITHFQHMQGEKEVFVRHIKLNQVTRVFNLDKQIIDEVLNDPTSAVGQYCSQHKADEDLSLMGSALEDNLIQKWRWEEQTEDCLPVKMRSEKKV